MNRIERAEGLALNAGAHLLMIVLSAIFLFPFLWMIATSFKYPADIYSLSLIPSQPTLDNYIVALTKFPFARWFANSVLVATLTTLSVAFFDSLAGYVLARPGLDAQITLYFAPNEITAPANAVPTLLDAARTSLVLPLIEQKAKAVT